MPELQCSSSQTTAQSHSGRLLTKRDKSWDSWTADGGDPRDASGTQQYYCSSHEGLGWLKCRRMSSGRGGRTPGLAGGCGMAMRAASSLSYRQTGQQQARSGSRLRSWPHSKGQGFRREHMIVGSRREGKTAEDDGFRAAHQHQHQTDSRHQRFSVSRAQWQRRQHRRNRRQQHQLYTIIQDRCVAASEARLEFPARNPLCVSTGPVPVQSRAMATVQLTQQSQHR